MKAITTILAAVMLCGYVACQKKSGTEVTPTKAMTPDTVLTTGNLQGKWEVIKVVGQTYQDGKLKQTQEWIKDSGWWVEGMKRKQWWPEDISYISFKEDGTYQHMNSDSVPDSYMLKEILAPSGHWNSSFNETIAITDIRDTVNTEKWLYKYKQPFLVFGIENTDVIGSGIYYNYYYLTFEKQNQ